MAAFYGEAIKSGIVLSGNDTETMIQLKAPANQRIRLLSWSVSFDDTQSVGVRLEVVRQSTDGTMTAGPTPVKTDDSIAETLLTTARHTATVEPTTGDILDTITVKDGFSVIYPIGKEKICGGGDRIAIRAISPAGITPTVDVKMSFEE